MTHQTVAEIRKERMDRVVYTFEEKIALDGMYIVKEDVITNVTTISPSVQERITAIQERAAYCGVALALPTLFKYCVTESQHRLLDRACYEIPDYEEV